MDITQASVFLAGSVLTMLGFVVIVAACIVINNLIHKFWKPVRIFTTDSFTLFGSQYDHNRFMTAEEYAKIAPNLDELKDQNGKSK